MSRVPQNLQVHLLTGCRDDMHRMCKMMACAHSDHLIGTEFCQANGPGAVVSDEAFADPLLSLL